MVVEAGRMSLSSACISVWMCTLQVRRGCERAYCFDVTVAEVLTGGTLLSVVVVLQT